jgi:hypothetical protein
MADESWIPENYLLALSSVGFAPEYFQYTPQLPSPINKGKRVFRKQKNIVEILTLPYCCLAILTKSN